MKDRKTQIKKEIEKEKIENKENIKNIENKLKEFESNDKSKKIKSITSFSTNFLALTSVMTGILPGFIAPLYIFVTPTVTYIIDKIYKKAKNINIKGYDLDEEIKEKINLKLKLQNLKEQDKILDKSLNLLENYDTNINDKNIDLNTNKEKIENKESRINTLSSKMVIQNEINNLDKNLKPKADASKAFQILYDIGYVTAPLLSLAAYMPNAYLESVLILASEGVAISIPYSSIFTFIDAKKNIKEKTLDVLKSKKLSLDNNYNTENDKKELEYLREKCSIEKIGYLNKKIYLKEKQEQEEKRNEYINNYYMKKERIKNNSKQKVYVKTK